MEFSNGLTPAEAERLALLIEECAEVQQAATKILRHGYESWNPDLLVNQGQSKHKYTNRVDLAKELGDLKYAVHLLYENGDVDVSVVDVSMERKAVNTPRYLHHQERK